MAGVEALVNQLGGGEKGLEAYARIMGPEAKGLSAILTKYVDNPVLLMQLDKSANPEDREQAKLIREQLKQVTQTFNRPIGNALP